MTIAFNFFRLIISNHVIATRELFIGIKALELFLFNFHVNATKLNLRINSIELHVKPWRVMNNVEENIYMIELTCVVNEFF